MNSLCRKQFPIVDGILVLINEATSVFALADFHSRRKTTLVLDAGRGHLKRWIKKTIPRLGINVIGSQNYDHLAKLLLSGPGTARILVIGGSILGDGMAALTRDSRIELVESDVSFGPRTQIISDAHDLPFAENSFDAVILQAVLQCLTDPARCVQEVHRVLKPRGLAYAEASFIQQVVNAPYDFTRYTHLGLRRLFRRFDEVRSGPVGGPAAALAWTIQYFLLSATESKAVRAAVRAFCGLSLFWLKYFDYFLVKKSGSFEAATGFYFMGRKSEVTLDDRALLRLYRGPK